MSWLVAVCLGRVQAAYQGPWYRGANPSTCSPHRPWGNAGPASPCSPWQSYGKHWCSPAAWCPRHHQCLLPLRKQRQNNAFNMSGTLIFYIFYFKKLDIVVDSKDIIHHTVLLTCFPIYYLVLCYRDTVSLRTTHQCTISFCYREAVSLRLTHQCSLSIPRLLCWNAGRRNVWI